MPRIGRLRQFQGRGATRSLMSAVVSGPGALVCREVVERRRRDGRQQQQLQHQQLPEEYQYPPMNVLMERIHDKVVRCTLFMTIFSRFLYFHVLRCLRSNLPLPPLTQYGLQELRSIFAGVRPADTARNSVGHPHVAQSKVLFLNQYPGAAQPLRNLDLSGLPTILNYEMKKHATACSNHFIHTFAARCEAWAKYRLGNMRHVRPTARVKRNMIKAIVDEMLDDTEGPPEQQEYLPGRFQGAGLEHAAVYFVVDELRRLFPRAPGLVLNFPLTKEWLADTNNWFTLLTFYMRLNAMMHGAGLPRFDLMPLCSPNARCITLDHLTLCRLYDVPTAERSTTRWSHFLRLGRLHLHDHPGVNHKTPISMQTDGVRVIVLCEKMVERPSDDDDALCFALDKESDKPAKQPAKKQKRRLASCSSSDNDRSSFGQPRGVVKMRHLEDLGGDDEPDIVGVDPGVSTMFAAVDANNNFCQMTRRHYNDAVGITAARDQLEQWKVRERIHPLENSIQPSACSTERSFRRHIRTYTAVIERLVTFYCKRRVTRLRLDKYIRRDKFLDSFISSSLTADDISGSPFIRRAQGRGKESRIQHDLRQHREMQHRMQQQREQEHQERRRRRVIAFGAATFKRALKGWSCVPGKRLLYRLQQRAPVVLVDEYNTSQVASATLGRTRPVFRHANVKEDETVQRRRRVIWGIREYYQPYDQENRPPDPLWRLTDRDRNAAINMRDLFSYWLVHHRRPIQFTRAGTVAAQAQAAQHAQNQGRDRTAGRIRFLDHHH